MVSSSLLCDMRLILSYIAITFMAALSVSCGNSSNELEKAEAIDKSVKEKGDKMIYGLTCDGCTDSTIVFLPNEGGDPVTYNIEKATHNKQIFGKPEIGDWIGIILNPANKHEAMMVIDLDQLKGTWSYEVVPTLKEMKTKTNREIRAEITDSMKEILFVPRQYGFTLKRHFQASPVGLIYKGNSLSDESIVEYPKVKIYTGWHVFNGKLILRLDTVDERQRRIPDSKVVRDTATFLYMLDDSLALRIKDSTIGFRRQKNAMSANKKAAEAAAKMAVKDSIR